ncbi:MAG: alanine--glyoxylate aminotransferase family protein [Bacteroidia bacterium]
MMLLTPGPVPLPGYVHEAMARPIIPHRAPGFEAFYREILSGLKYLFQCREGAVCTMACSGTGAVEAAMYSLFGKGDKIAILSNGKFSERWNQYGKSLGCEICSLELDWGKVAGADALCELAEGCKGIVLTHCETSTGACLDLEEVAIALRRAYPEILIVVDGITTIGAQAFYFDDWEIDLAVVASQKALMAPAGLCAFAVSRRAEKVMQDRSRSEYLFLGNYLQAASKNTYPFTPPLVQLYALDAVLQNLLEASLPQWWNRSRIASAEFRARLLAHGGTLFPERSSDSLSVFQLPGADHGKLRQMWASDGYILAGGQEKLTGKVLRISHMGLAAGLDLDAFWNYFAKKQDSPALTATQVALRNLQKQAGLFG